MDKGLPDILINLATHVLQFGFALLENVGDGALKNLMAEANWFGLPGGMELKRDGENAQALFLVVTGSLGVFVAVIGCVRCYYVYTMAVATYDVTWWAEAHWICSQVEIDVSLVR